MLTYRALMDFTVGSRIIRAGEEVTIDSQLSDQLLRALLRSEWVEAVPAVPAVPAHNSHPVERLRTWIDILTGEA